MIGRQGIRLIKAGFLTTVAMFSVGLVFYTFVPVWHQGATAMTSAYNQIVPNAGMQANMATMGVDLNYLIMYMFIMFGVGFGVYILLQWTISEQGTGELGY